MKKADFDWSEASKRGFNQEKYDKALRDLKKYEDIFRSHPGVITGYWVGLKNGDPYIMVVIERGRCQEPKKLIPNKLGSYEVYYIEGTFHL